MSRLPWVARLLLRGLDAGDRDDAVGDLLEVHAARRARLGGHRAWLASSVDAAWVLVRLRLHGLRRRPPFSAAELRLGVRMMRRQPWLSVTAVLALAVGIGIAGSVFTLVSRVMLADLPFPNGDRWVNVEIRDGRTGLWRAPSPEGYRTVRDRATLLAAVGAYRTQQLNLTDGDADPVAVRTAYVTAGSFQLMGVEPIAGRLVGPSDGGLVTERVVLIGEAVWRSRWGGDPALVGRRIELGDEPHTVVGIMPADFGFPDVAEAWTTMDEATLDGTSTGAHRDVELFGVRAEGVAIDEVSDQLTTLLLDERSTLHTEPFTRRNVGGIAEMGAVVVALVLMLLVTAGNVANLVLARTYARRGELAVRTALGADRGRLVGQVFLEVLVLAGVAALLGYAAASVVVGWLERTVNDLPFWVDLSPDWTVVLFVAGLALLAGLVAGVLPALKATGGRIAETLPAGGRSSGNLRFGRFASAMILTQVALTVALLAGAGSLTRALAGYHARSEHLPEGDVITARVYFAPPDGAPDSVAVLHRRMVEAVEAIPGPAAVSFATRLPRDESPLRPVEVELDGEIVSGVAPATSVAPGFFAALGIEPLAGREFPRVGTEADALEVVVNRPFVDRFLEGRNALGRRVRFPGEGGPNAVPTWHTIVGVVPDLGMSPGDPAHAAGLYRRMGATNYFHVVMRSAGGDPQAFVGPLRDAIASVDRDIRVDEVMPLERAGWESRALLTGLSAAMAALGGMALFLSLMGLYAIVSFTVTGRTREIGIRVALGASRTGVLRSVLGRSAWQLAAGGLVGSLVGLAVAAGTQVLPIRVAPGAPWLAPVVAVGMMLAGLLATWVPARRALAIQPVEALRSE